MKILAKVFSTFEEREFVKVKNYKLFKNIEIIDTKILNRYTKISMDEMLRKHTIVMLFILTTLV
ncbi:MAG: hypothetical protein K1060chlam3_00970, partial [Candidatus Anoxychlamydiales bacterium]|nr:hypothetical protein [Candidatus Anoxychlamydiales bacterium]